MDSQFLRKSYKERGYKWKRSGRDRKKMKKTDCKNKEEGGKLKMTKKTSRKNATDNKIRVLNYCLHEVVPACSKASQAPNTTRASRASIKVNQ